MAEEIETEGASARDELRAAFDDLITELQAARDRAKREGEARESAHEALEAQQRSTERERAKLQ